MPVDNNMPEMYPEIRLLQQYHHIAIVGLSASSDRPSYLVARSMQTRGYNISPINPRYAGEFILGKRVYASLAEAQKAGEQIEIVDVFRRAEDTLSIVEEAVQVGARVLWLQLGIRNAETQERAQEAGLIFVQDKCIKIEAERLH